MKAVASFLAAVATAALMIGLGMMEAPANDLVYRVPGMENARVVTNVVYKVLPSHALHADYYFPASDKEEAAIPAVIYVLGDADPRTLTAAKDWAVFRSYGQLATTKGFAGITFNHRSSLNFQALADVRSDVVDLIQFVSTNRTSPPIDPSRLAIWFFSGSGPHLGAAFERKNPSLRCVVGFYPLFAPPARIKAVPENSAIEALKHFSPNVPPMLLAKAGRDRPDLNSSIDAFREAAKALPVELTFLEHPTGLHAFDLRNNDDTSREIVRKALEFVENALKRSK